MKIWKEVFKLGTHTDNKGLQRSWSEADLDTIVSKYNDQLAANKHSAPVVVGHPVLDSPAYGWVNSLKKEGTSIFAEFTEMDQNFLQLVKDGRYKEVSISLYPDLLLKHVGFLGAIPPAVKGLKPIQFARQPEDEIIINFQENGEITMPDKIIQGILDFLSKTFSPEIAAQTQAKVEELKKQFPPVAPPPVAPPTPPVGGDPNAAAAANKPITQLSEDQKQELQELQTKISALEKEKAEMSFNEFFNEHIKTGKLVPAQKETIKALYFKLDQSEETISFSEGENKVDKKLNTVFAEFINNLPNQIEFNEFTKYRGSVSSEEIINNKVKQFQGIK